MPSFNDVVDQMRAALAVSDPDLDTSTGTTTRKIIESVAESIAESYVDQHMLTYQYDIDSKSDTDLDNFCQLFGITRFGAKRATGTVVFVRQGAQANVTSYIPVNTQIATANSPQVVVTTLAPVFMDVGVLTVIAPVQAVDGGTTGNIGASTLTVPLTPLESISTVTNIQPLTGGTSQETDTALRQRWKDTVFRNLAGTAQFYLGLALADGLANDSGCTKANVLGSTKNNREQIQVESGAAQSQAQDIVYVYPASVTVGLDIDNGDVLLRDHDYTFDTTTNPPTVRDAGGLVDGQIYDLEYEYVSTASRNDVANGISNRIDIWCNGIRPVEAQQNVFYQATKVFVTSSSGAYPRADFVRPDGSHPTLNNIFIPLAFGPIVTLPPTLTVGAETFFQATVDNPIGTTDIHGNIYAYGMIHQDGPFGWTPQSLFGLEWDHTHIPVATGDAAVFVIGDVGDEGDTDISGYTYNQVPTAVQSSIDSWRLMGTDAKAHQAKEIALRFSLVLMISPNSSPSAVIGNVATAISNYLSALSFDAAIAVNEVLGAVLGVAGVTNARFKTAFDYTGWSYPTSNDFPIGVQRVIDGVVQQTYVDHSGNPIDIELGDDELPAFDSLDGDGSGDGQPGIRAQNTFWTALG